MSNTARKTGKNFDEITISSRETFDEMIFARELSRKIMKEASSPTEPQKMDELKAQVQSGSYQIVIDEIAKKMLLSWKRQIALHTGASFLPPISFLPILF